MTSLAGANVKEAGRAPDLPRVVFAGRSNVGKSSLINSLVGRKKLAHTSSTPGRTRTINLFNINNQWIFADLPGYGYARASKLMRAGWQRLIGNFLELDGRIKLAILIVDSRREPASLDTVMREYLDSYEIPVQVVATKIDKVRSSRRLRFLEQIERSLESNSLIAYSSRTGEGKEGTLANHQRGLNHGGLNHE